MYSIQRLRLQKNSLEIKVNAMIGQDAIKKDLPDVPGVYEFLAADGEVLYVGKATSLRDRVRSYFSYDVIDTRGQRIVDMVALSTDVRITPTLSILEALILEAARIAELLPRYNVALKDNKSFNFVVITKEKFPKLVTIRGRTLDIAFPKKQIKYSFGPFPSGTSLRNALTIIRKLFPYRDEKCTPAEDMIAAGKKPRACFNRHIGLCPGVCTGEISAREYAKTVNHLRLFFQGKKGELVRTLEREMKAAAKAQKFEEAQRLKKLIFSLDHINDIALIRADRESDLARVLDAERGEPTISQSIDENGEGVYSVPTRIEAYDIAHISGSSTVGVMVVVENGIVKKSDYRKFKIRGAKKGEVNDIKNLKEVIVRRLGHAEWPLPRIMVVDGGVAQVNAAKEVLAEKGFNIEVIAVVKDDRHKARELIGQKVLVDKFGVDCLLANSEAHRFAIYYHRNLRSRLFGK